MSNVGSFHAELVLNTDKFSTPIAQATRDADRFATAAGGMTVAANAASAGTTNAGVALDKYTASSAVAATSTAANAAATMHANRSGRRYNTTLVEIKNTLQKTVTPLTATHLGMNRLASQARDATKASRDFGRAAALTNREVGVLGFFMSRLARRHNEYTFAVLEGTRVAGHKHLNRMARATVALESAFGGLSRAVSGAFAGMFRASDMFRTMLVNMGQATQGAGRLRQAMTAAGQQIRATFGPLVKDIAVVGRVAGQAIAPLGTMAAKAAEGVGRLAQRFAGFRSASKSVGGLAFRFFQLSETMLNLGKRFPRFERQFEALSSVFLKLGDITSKVGADIFNRWRKSAANILAVTRDRFGAVATAVSSAFARALPAIRSFAGGVAYVGREVAKGIATSAKLVSGIGFLAAKVGQYAVAAAGAAAKTAILGAHFIRSSGLLGKVAKAFVFAAAASTGFGGALAAIPLGTAAIAQMIPGVGKLGGMLSNVLGPAFRAVGRAAGMLAAKFATVLTGATALAGGIGLLGGAAMAFLVKSQMAAGDAIAKTSDKLGIQTEKLIGLRHAAAMSGVESDKLDTALQRMVRRLADVKPDSPLSQALAKAGLNAETLRRQSPDEQMRSIADGMQSLGSQSEKVALAFKLFDSEGVGLVNTLQHGSTALDAAQKDAEKLGISMSRVDGAMIEQANDAIHRLKQLFVGVGRTLAVRVAPFIEAAVVKLVDMGTAGEGMGAMVDKALKWAVKGTVWLLDMVDKGIVKFQQMRMAALTFSASATSGLAGFLRGADNLTSWVDWGLKGFAKLRINIVRMFGSLFDGIAKVMAMMPEMPRWLGGGMKETAVGIYTEAGDLMRETAKLLQEELDRSEGFNFDRIASGLDAAAKSMQNRAAKVGEDLDKKLAGQTLGKRFETWGADLIDDARKRAEAAADRAITGTAHVADQVDAAAEKLQKALPGHAGAMEAGSVAAFSAALGRADEAAARVSRAPSTPSVNASTPQQQQQQQGKCCDGVETTNRLLGRMLVIWEEWKRDRDAGEGVEIGLGSLP